MCDEARWRFCLWNGMADANKILPLMLVVLLWFHLRDVHIHTYTPGNLLHIPWIIPFFFISRNSTTMPSTVSRSPPINDPVLIVCMYIHIYIMHTWVWHETYGRYQIFCIVECNNGWDMVIERPAKKKIHQIRVIWFLNNVVNRITIFKFLNWK